VTQKDVDIRSSAVIKNWLERDDRYVWHPMSRLTPREGGGTASASRLVVAEGDGAWISDIEGNRYLDGMAGLWCVNVGYAREELARAAYDQLVKLPYYPLTMGHTPAVELGEKLNEWLEDDYVFFFSNSGSEANETAFKVARQFHQQNGQPGRWKFVARYRAYHGNTMGAAAATGQASTATSRLRQALCTSPRPTAIVAPIAPTVRCATCSALGRWSARYGGSCPRRWQA
jgi:taurine-pyruvate aminotransferase